MKYQNRYILTRDIDWFCQINGIWIHAASAGGELPHIINNRSQNIMMQNKVAAELDDNFSEVEFVNEELISKYLTNNSIYNHIEPKSGVSPFEVYVSSFRKMAGKGFYSFDRTNINDPSDNNYHLVAYPKSRLIDQMWDAPKTLKIKYAFDIESIKNGSCINLIELINKAGN